ncbi:MAG: ComEC/Rec2 family competence protein [Streptosporangiales bacterium]
MSGSDGLARRTAPAEPPDLRLAAPAAAAWLTALVLLVADARTAVITGGCCALLAAVTRFAGGRLPGGMRWTVPATLACAGAAALCTGAHLAVLTSGPAGRLAAAEASVQLRLVVTADPEVGDRSGPAWREPTVSVRASLHRLRHGGRTHRARQPILVLAHGHDWASLTPGQRVTARGTVATPRDRGTLAAVFFPRSPPHVVAQPGPLQAGAERLRAGLREAVAGLPAAERGLVPALVVGDTSLLSARVEEEFKRTGLTHLLVVSGANLAIVTGAILALGRRAGAGSRLLSIAGAGGVVGFVILARPEPSVLRAAVMGGVGLLALSTGRPRRGLPPLFAAVLVLVYAQPALARSYGFALSVLATFGLLVLAPPWRDRMVARGIPRPLAESIAVPAAAQVMCGPVIAMLAAQVNLVGVAANLAAAPAVAPVTVLGVLATVAQPLLPVVATALGWCAWLPAWWLVHVARVAAAVPGASIGWPGGVPGAVLLAVLTTALLFLAPHRWPRRIVATGAAVALAAGGILHAVAPTWPPPGWFLVACDVGQGDGLVLNAGGSAAVVVDAGPEPAPMDACLTALDVERIPLLVITHLDADHVGGIAGVFRGRDVGVVLTSPLREPASGWRLLARATARHDTPVREPSAGAVWRVGPVRLRVLSPRPPLVTSEPNEAAVVLRAETAGHSVLLTADADEDSERRILYRGANLRADVLKVPHHGSADFDAEFLAASGARLAVISVGADNGYGHPAPSLLAELRTLGMRIVRTDRVGAVAVCDSGGRLAVATRQPRAPP